MNKPQQNGHSETIAKLNELYISTRRKYIMQTEVGYVTFSRDKIPTVWTLNDGMIANHLAGSKTYGIFNGNHYNKFITFDVDYADNQEMARWATLNVIRVLQDEFNISANDIHVSFSGNKGYHVDLFFDTQISADEARRFYTQVINAAGLPSEKVEFRPTWTQAVKFPLGIHLKTGRRCWFVDRETLEPIESFDYLNDVEPMDSALILDALIELTDEQEAEFERVVRETDTSVNVVNTSDAYAKAMKILDAGQLLESGTRHTTTVLLASFFNSQGFEREEAVEAILDVLYNTPPDYFSAGSEPEMWEREAVRLVDLAFDRDYKLGNDDQEITVYKSEMLAVLNAGTFRQKQMAYAMLVTSKRYGETFYLTMSTASKMTGASHGTVNSAIKKLVEIGFIEYVRKRELDKAQSRQKGRPIYKANRYRLLIDKPQAGEHSIEVKSAATITDVTTALFDVKEVRSLVGRTEFTNRWKPVYAS